MDEIDSIGSSRVEGHSGGDSEVQRTMLELLNQLDGFEATKNIKVIMATNRIDILDPALLRPGACEAKRSPRFVSRPNSNERRFLGRIDRKIEFPAPDEKARADILKIHSRKMNLMRGINMRKIAENIPGASGAEVKAVCTEAGMFALRERRIHVTQEDFEMAVGKASLLGARMQTAAATLFGLLAKNERAFSGYAKRRRQKHVDQKAMEVARRQTARVFDLMRACLFIFFA